jgi:hypothetical protein
MGIKSAKMLARMPKMGAPRFNILNLATEHKLMRENGVIKQVPGTRK